jgi:predicted 3-demethylubiquinone-9 3-methyltransferase (glyoxalase superfamily)
MQRITPCLWFDTQAEEAANFYVSLFEDSEVTTCSASTEPRAGTNVALVFFRLAGLEYMAINGGPQFPFTEAVSFSVSCKDQDEVDRLGRRSPPMAARRASAVGSGSVRPELADHPRTDG